MSVFMNVITSLIPSFASIIGMPIILAEPKSDQLSFRENIEISICDSYESSDCNFDLRQMPFQSSLTGWSYIASDTTNGLSACVIQIPKTESDHFSNNIDIISNYGIETDISKISQSDFQISDSESQLFKFLIDLSACANNPYTSNNLLIERNYIFAAMTMSLINPSTELVSNPHSSVARKYSYILDSEPLHYATDIGDRINYETIKQYAANKLKQDGCKNVEVQKSSDLNIRYIDKEISWVPTCKKDPNKKITITDANLHLFFEGASNDIIIEESKKPKPKYDDIEPIFEQELKLPKAAGFNGDFTKVLQYSFSNANKITGIE